MNFYAHSILTILKPNLRRHEFNTNQDIQSFWILSQGGSWHAQSISDLNRIENSAQSCPRHVATAPSIFQCPSPSWITTVTSQPVYCELLGDGGWVWFTAQDPRKHSITLNGPPSIPVIHPSSHAIIHSSSELRTWSYIGNSPFKGESFHHLCPLAFFPLLGSFQPGLSLSWDPLPFRFRSPV